MNKTRTQSGGVKVLDKALDLLEELGADQTGRSLTDVVTALGLPSATVYRLLRHLARRGYVEQDPTTKLYYLGLRVLSLRGSAIRAIQLVARARPSLREMMLATDCVSQMAVLRDGQVVYIDRVETPNTAAVFVPIGNRAPAYCTALGKVLLAGCTDEELDAYFAHASPQQLTPNTLASPPRLRAHLELVRRLGYAQDIQEQKMGLWCVAAPVRDFTGRTIAAVSVAMHDEPSPEHLLTLRSTVTQTALRISEDLGYRSQAREAAIDIQLY